MEASVRTTSLVRGAAGGALTLAANLFIWGAGRIGDVDFVVPGRDGGSPVEVGPAEVALTTLVPFLVGTVLFAVVAARGPRWRLAVLGAATLVAVGSLAMPLTLDTDGWTRGLLAVMHLVTGAVFVSTMATAKSPSTSR